MVTCSPANGHELVNQNISSTVCHLRPTLRRAGLQFPLDPNLYYPPLEPPEPGVKWGCDLRSTPTGCRAAIGFFSKRMGLKIVFHHVSSISLLQPLASEVMAVHRMEIGTWTSKTRKSSMDLSIRHARL